MATHRIKLDASVLLVDAVRWHKIGDHPAVTSIYGAGTRIDSACGHRSDEHGFLDEYDPLRSNGKRSVGVCPGDWIVADSEGRVRRLRPREFDALYEPVA